ncbi:efflux RND transporter permease subunit [Staphylococcus massiliensis]|uniref:efflux RND transporter permease subunit n=1 Tax=Staphylococcus massiliensis TaxID=555791 RepID=UPI0003102117|nr:efflux RND transporter permease subunit [Staphylococcus massiliensis]MCG3411514.1 efflux RND transporter permease subunit [Staphylococcus massiliensis]PNZ98781.1 AcrB/AcrD/AcrF family protein [Staphylococcus massiliensis CCUG 55927]
MVRKMIRFSLSNKFALILMALLILLGGVYSSLKLRMEMLPDTEPPVLTVQTKMPGATPDTVSEEVSDKMDDAIKGMSDVKSVKSESLENASVITVEYKKGVDLDNVESKLKKEVEKLSFREGVEEPEITRFNMNSLPVLVHSFTNKEGDLKKVSKTIEEELVPKLETVDGVQKAQVDGQTSKQVTLEFDKDKLNEVGLNENQVGNYIKSISSKAPLGLYQFDDKEKSIIVDGSFDDPSEIENLEIPVAMAKQMPSTATAGEGGAGGGQAPSGGSGEASAQKVSLSELAEVNIGDERDSISKTNGKDAVNVQITKSEDANTVKVANKVKDEIKKIEDKHPELNSTIVRDTAKPIQDSLTTMIEKAILGSIVAIVVILFFLRNISTTAISVVSIPLSILIALVALKLCDVSLNILTLGALTIAIGRVIDDSIVVIENIYRRLSSPTERMKGDNLIVDATKEVFIPIMSSTIVTVVVFLPLIFVSGQVGEMFKPFALAIAFSLLASLLVSLTVVPALGSSFFKNGLAKRDRNEKTLGNLGRKYQDFLKKCLNNKKRVLLISLGLLLLSAVIGVFAIGTSYLSAGDNKVLTLSYKPKPGEPEEKVLKNAEEAQKFLNDKKHVENVQYSVGAPSPNDPTGQTNNTALLVDYDKKTPDFENEAQRVLDEIEKFDHNGTWKNQDMGDGNSTKSLEVQVSGPSRDAIKDTVDKVEKKVKDVEGLANVKSDLSETYDQYKVKVDQEKAAQFGLSANSIAMQMNENIPEQKVAKVDDGGNKIDVKIKKSKDTDWSEEKLNQTSIPSPTGKDVTLSQISELEKAQTPSKIVKNDGDYASTISAEITEKDVGGVTGAAKKKVDEIETPKNVDISLGGTNEDISDAFSQLFVAMAAAIIIVYLVLVLTFKGALAPFTILFSLPFTIIGVVFGLLISGETLSVTSMIGLLMLIGIVVTNAIVLVDRIINKEREGLNRRDAIIEAAGTRIRPILMTAIATIGALLPMLFGGDGSVLISKSLAITVIGGLLSSTLLTLVVVPVIYELLFSLKNKYMKQGPKVATSGSYDTHNHDDSNNYRQASNGNRTKSSFTDKLNNWKDNYKNRKSDKDTRSEQPRTKQDEAPKETPKDEPTAKKPKTKYFNKDRFTPNHKSVKRDDVPDNEPKKAEPKTDNPIVDNHESTPTEFKKRSQRKRRPKKPKRPVYDENGNINKRSDRGKKK